LSTNPKITRSLQRKSSGSTSRGREEEDAVSYIESIKDVEFTSNLNLSPVLAVSALSLIPVEMFGDT